MMVFLFIDVLEEITSLCVRFEFLLGQRGMRGLWVGPVCFVISFEVRVSVNRDGTLRGSYATFHLVLTCLFELLGMGHTLAHLETSP